MVGTNPFALTVRYSFGPVTQTTYALETMNSGSGDSPAPHAHSASEITRGIFALRRIPNLPASKITSGTLSGDVTLIGELAADVVRFGGSASPYSLGNVYGAAVCAAPNGEPAWSYIPNGAFIVWHNGNAQMRTHRNGIEPESNNTEDLGRPE